MCLVSWRLRHVLEKYLLRTHARGNLSVLFISHNEQVKDEHIE